MPSLQNKLPRSAVSWLALCPSTAIKPTTYPQRNPAVLARIKALRATLLEIKETLDVRKYFLHLHAHRGRFCPSCTHPQQAPGTCGPTCPLLRSPKTRTCVPISREWVEMAEATIEVYRGLVAAFNACGANVRIAQLRKWEGVVAMLRVECMSWAEMQAELIQGRVFEVKKGVFVEGWGFEGRWGSGIGVEGDLEMGGM